MEFPKIPCSIAEYDLKPVRDVSQHALKFLIFKIWAPDEYTYTKTLI